MQPYILISLIFLGLVVMGILVFVASSARKSKMAGLEKYPQGHWIGIGISIGAGFGVALGSVFDNLGLGIGMGMCLGLAIGAALEQKNRDNLRPLTDDEQKTRRWGVVLGLIMLIAGVGAFAFILLLRSG